MNEEIANVTGAAIAGTDANDQTTPAAPLLLKKKKQPPKPLSVVLKRAKPSDPTTKTISGKNGNGGKQGSLFPNTQKKIGLDLPDEDFRGDLMKKALAKSKERSYG